MSAEKYIQAAKNLIEKIENMVIWGNHSATQYPDFYHAKISDRSALEVIQDEKGPKAQDVTVVA